MRIICDFGTGIFEGQPWPRQAVARIGVFKLPSINTSTLDKIYRTMLNPLSNIWVNFITTSLFDRTLESWLIREIMLKWPQDSG